MCSYGKESRRPPRRRGANDPKEPLDSTTCELKPELGSPELSGGRSLGTHSTGCRGGADQGWEGTLAATPLSPGLGSTLLRRGSGHSAPSRQGARTGHRPPHAQGPAMPRLSARSVARGSCLHKQKRMARLTWVCLPFGSLFPFPAQRL